MQYLASSKQTMADTFPVFHDTLDDTPPPTAARRLIGHEALLDTMLAEYQAGKMHHATILSGPQGIGKATLAFQFAKQVFALTGETNASEKIEAGTHPSLLHLTRSWNEDTKKFRTEIVIADVHRANHFLSRTASGGGTRIIIVDPADDMNRNAANALLKNLEEPPAKTHYFLISHVAGRLLPTIRSRCRVVDVPALTEAQVTEVLTRNLGLEQSEAEELSRYSGGSVRQAMTMARYGGIDIVAALNAFVADKKFSAVAAQNLATAVSDRESEPRYMLLTDLIEQRLADVARGYALNGNTQGAVQISALYQDVQQQRTIAEGYKLDRKLEVFNLLRRVHPNLAAA
jgi:DNA polymerase III subunit delta'